MFGTIEETLDSELRGMVKLHKLYDDSTEKCDPIILVQIIKEVCSIDGLAESEADKKVTMMNFLKKLGHSTTQTVASLSKIYLNAIAASDKAGNPKREEFVLAMNIFKC